MADDLVLNVRTFGAGGNGKTDDAAAINRAAASAAASGRDVYFPAGIYNIKTAVTSPARFTFAEGARIDSSNRSALELHKGYNAGPYQVFGRDLVVRIKYWTMDVLYFEHFGAQVLTDPRQGINDSTVAIQKLFQSLQGEHYPGEPPDTPAVNNSFTVRLLGIYGISDEIKVNPGGYQICGSGVGLFGTGFKWVGPDVPENEDKAMLRLFGPQWAEIDGLIFLGVPRDTRPRPLPPPPPEPPPREPWPKHRLYAGIALQSNGSVPSPYSGGLGRRTTIRRCSFGDSVFYFHVGDVGYQFEHGIITDGDDGNDDFHIFESCIIVGAEHGITIGNSQNVDVQIRNCAVGYAKTAGVWQRNGGELLVDGLYCYFLPAGASFFKVGDKNGTQGAPNSRITMRLVGGEHNWDGVVVPEPGVVPEIVPPITSFVHNAYTAGGTILFWDLTRCEIALPKPHALFLTGDPCAYSLTFDNCDVSGKFSLPFGSASYRNLLTFRGCRNLGLVMVDKINPFSQALLDVEVQNCMAQSFEAGPWALLREGRFVGAFSYKHRFGALNPPIVISLADPSLYATTSTLSDKVGIGNAGFGFESELGYKTYYFGSLNQFTLEFPGIIPARSVVFGCQVGVLDSNFLANGNNSWARVFVGDRKDYRRYGSLPGPDGFVASSVPDGFVPFVTASPREVVLYGGWENEGETWTWDGNIIKNNHGLFTPDMVRNRIRFTTGALAGAETTVTAFNNSASLEVADSKQGSGEAVMFIPFAAGKRMLIAPAYFQMMSNSDIVRSKYTQNLVYAEPITPS